MGIVVSNKATTRCEILIKDDFRSDAGSIGNGTEIWDAGEPCLRR